MTTKRTVRVLLAVTGLFLMLFLATASDLFYLLHPRESINTPLALNAIIVYWLLTLVGLAVVLSWKKRWKQFLVCIASVAAGLLAAELVLRLSGIVAAMPPLHTLGSRRLHHVYPANTTMYEGTFDGTRVTVRTNADGLRTRYSRETFSRHAVRIVVLGDSFTFGLGVPREDAFPARLEAMLRRESGNCDIAVLNAGIIGYSPFLERLQFENIIFKYKPTHVLLLLDATDIGDDYKYMNQSDGAAHDVRFPSARDDRRRRHSALVQLVHGSAFFHRKVVKPLVYPFGLCGRLLNAGRLHSGRHDYYRFRLRIGGAVENNRFFIYRHPLSQTLPYFEATMSQIRLIAHDARRLGATFVLLVAPRFQHWNTAECPDNWESDSYALDERFQYEYFRYFERCRGNVEFAIYNLLPAFQKTERFPLVFKADPHWNKAGHAFVADTVARYLLDRDIVRGSRGAGGRLSPR